MIRFVDIRGQGIGYRFAFFDTSVDAFVRILGQEVFDDFKELRERYGDEQMYGPLREKIERLESLCSEWTKDGLEDDLEKWYEDD